MKKKYIIDRFISLCYDYMFVIIVLGTITLGLQFLNEILFHVNNIWLYIVLIDIVLYFIGFTILSLKLKGSLGKSLNDLYIESTKGRITFGRILFREIIFKQLMYLSVIGFIAELVFFIIKKDTLHDYYLKTKVKKKINNT